MKKSETFDQAFWLLKWVAATSHFWSTVAFMKDERACNMSRGVVSALKQKTGELATY